MRARTGIIAALAAAVLVAGCASSIAGNPGIDPAAASASVAVTTSASIASTTPATSSPTPPPTSTVPASPSARTDTPIRPLPPLVSTSSVPTAPPATTPPTVTGESSAGTVRGIPIDGIAAALKTDPVAIDDAARAAADPKELEALDKQVTAARKAGLDIWVVLIGRDVDQLTDVSDAVAIKMGGTVIVVDKASFAVSSKQFSNAQLKKAEDVAASASSAVQAASLLVEQLRGLAASSAPTTGKTTGKTSGAPLSQFQLADHSIGCAIIDQTVRCDVMVPHTYQPPKNPHPDCQGDYGSSIQLTPKDAATFICISDTVYDPTLPVLANGSTTTVGDLMCFASKQSVWCMSLSSGHSFIISPAAYTIT